MSFIVRFSFDVPFGKKAGALALCRKWHELQAVLGWPEPRVLEGSIGALESGLEYEYQVESLSELESMWSKLLPAVRSRNGERCKVISLLLRKRRYLWVIELAPHGL